MYILITDKDIVRLKPSHLFLIGVSIGVDPCFWILLGSWNTGLNNGFKAFEQDETSK
jgi:hypothetical protein